MQVTVNGVPTPELLKEVVRRVVAVIHPEKIILFGSAARGTMGPDSDLDLLVIASVPHRRKAALAIRESLKGLGVPKDVIVATPEDIHRYGDVVGYILRPALREGKVIYAA